LETPPTSSAEPWQWEKNQAALWVHLGNVLIQCIMEQKLIYWALLRLRQALFQASYFY
jgi:hypothetical protein